MARRAGFFLGVALMLAGQGLLIAGALGVLLVLWAVGAWRRIRRLRGQVRRAFAALDGALGEQQRWVVQWCAAPPRAGSHPPPAWVRRLAASAEQAALALHRLRRDPLDVAAMDSLHQARRALCAAWRADGDSGLVTAPGTEPASAWPPAEWVNLAHQEVPLAMAFNAQVAAYNAAVSQFPALLLAALLRHRRARPLESPGPG